MEVFLAKEYGPTPWTLHELQSRFHFVTFIGIPRTGGSLVEAHKVGVDLIVAGAFGHPRLWDKMMGGVTRDLLARMNQPVWMSY